MPDDTYFVTSSTAQCRPLLQSDRMAKLFVDVLAHYRSQGRYLLHEFVVMPDHFHVLLTPVQNRTLERVLQLLKGGFSYRARKELDFEGELWQAGYHDRRVRDATEYERIRRYILQNPVQRGLVTRSGDFPGSSANLKLDPRPQRLKPIALSA
jgi:putative transposase